MENTEKTSQPTTGGKENKNNILETAVITGVAGFASHEVTARSLDIPEETVHTVEILADGYMEDEDGNVMAATVIVDEEGRESIMFDTNHDGYADFMATDINHDGEANSDEITNLNGLDVDMSKPDANIIHQSIDSIAYDNSLPDYVNDADMDLCGMG